MWPTVCQYCTSRTILCYVSTARPPRVSTARRVQSYAMSVPRIAYHPMLARYPYHHTLSKYQAANSSTCRRSTQRRGRSALHTRVSVPYNVCTLACYCAGHRVHPCAPTQDTAYTRACQYRTPRAHACVSRGHRMHTCVSLCWTPCAHALVSTAPRVPPA